MKDWKYPKTCVVKVNENARKGMKFTVDLHAVVFDHLKSSLYDYEVLLEDGSHGKYKEEELDYFFDVNDKLKVIHSGEEGHVSTFDIRHKQVELYHDDHSYKVYLFSQVEKIKEQSQESQGEFEIMGRMVGKLVDDKQKAYGDSVSKVNKIMAVLLEDYDNHNGTYTIPKELLWHMFITVRDLDKINRNFSNPKGDLMGENSYQDKVGYALLAMRMYEENKKKEAK